MNYAKISHPALVALQGRLRGIHKTLENATRTIEGEWPGPYREGHAAVQQAEAAIAEIDDWLTDPTKQVREGDPHA